MPYTEVNGMTRFVPGGARPSPLRSGITAPARPRLSQRRQFAKPPMSLYQGPGASTEPSMQPIPPSPQLQGMASIPAQSIGEYTMPAHPSGVKYPGMSPEAAAAQTAAERSRLNSYGRGLFGPEGRNFGMSAPPATSRLDNAYNAAMSGQLRGGIPLEQQGFAAGQMRQPAPAVAAPEQRPLNEYGLRRMENFTPYGSPGTIPAGLPIGSVGSAQVRLNPQGGNTLMSRDAASYYNDARRDGADPVAARRSALRQSQDAFMQSDEGKAQVDRLRQTNMVNAQRRDDLRARAVARKTGSKLNEEVAFRLGGGKTSIGATNLSLKDRATLLAPDAQAGLSGTLGYSPASAAPDEVLRATVNSLQSLDPNDTDGRRAVLQGAMAARYRPGFGTGMFSGPRRAMVDLDSLLKDPDGYLKRKTKAPASPMTMTPTFAPGL